jgi:hypothetical protein
VRYEEIGVPDHQNVQGRHGCFGRGDHNIIGPDGSHKRFEPIYSPVQEQHPEVLVLHATGDSFGWVLDRILQAVKGPQESEVGLEACYIDQRGHLMVANGEGRGELGRVLVVGRRELLTWVGRC